MTRRLWPLLLIPILVVWLAAPREGPHLILPGVTVASSQGAPVAGGGLLGAPSVRGGLDSGNGTQGAEPSGSPFASFPRPGGAPHPSVKLGDWSCSDPPRCGEPVTIPQSQDGKAITGTASWWNSFGPGIYAALRPDLGSKGDLVIVCGGAPFHCVTAPVITSCKCLGPNSERLVDLSRDLFAEFADPSRGVVRITLQVVGR